MRGEYQKVLKQIPQENLIYLDESGFDLNIWIEEFLITELKPNQTLILDNAAFYKSAKTRELIESANCKLLYLPPYSPDFNPIEQKWSHVKTQVKKIRNKFDNFTECLDVALVRV